MDMQDQNQNILSGLRLVEGLFAQGRFVEVRQVGKQVLDTAGPVTESGWHFLVHQIIHAAEKELERQATVPAKKLNIAVVAVATGKYFRFVDPLVSSLRANFLTSHDVKIFVFSDTYKSTSDDVHVQKVSRKGFPGDTLYRYHYFASMYDVLRGFDYIFYLDADMSVCDVVGDEVIPSYGRTLVGVAHPGFFCMQNYLGTPETRSESVAFLPATQSRYCYWAGGFNGGRADAFLDMCVALARAVDEDARRGTTAVWHDESHLNRYFSAHAGAVMTLTPAYCYPEGTNLHLPMKRKIMALKKDHAEVRSL
ncbi:glycosyltransferase family protein [Arenibaculum pallidiluteum]|uniref:hypothetical protein n=1 Tax=Arenibaculum pallidiluteum TaxID=2812559 RepID=UPI001A959331|nr:hypothetical protein [Arenibaculum pallidiluteum]